MTISTQNPSATFLGNGVTSSFTANFVADQASDLLVIYTNDGVSTVLQNTAYTITFGSTPVGQLWPVGFTLAYPLTGNPIPNGSSLAVYRILPLQQLTSLGDQSNYYPTAIETALDVLCMQIQQVSARTGQFLGTWITDTYYSVGSIIVDGVNGANTGNYYMCAVANASDVWATDLANGDWVLAINVQLIASYATAAATSASAAAASAVEAGSTFTATSSTSNTIGTGNFTFATQANKNFIMGQPIIASSNANPLNFILGYVNSYSGTTLVITEQSNGGSGAHTDWNIGVCGTQGQSGSGAGTVTSASVVTANGFGGIVANATSTPAITLTTSVTGLLKGNGTAISSATAGTDYLTPAGSGAGLTALTAANISAGTAGIDVTGNAATVTSINGALSNGTNTSVSGSGTSGAPYEVSVATATSTVLGVVMPDNSSITISGGVISANISASLPAAFAIGSLIMATSGSNVSANGTIAGSVLLPQVIGASGPGTSGDGARSGTWRAFQSIMGTSGNAGLFQRVA